MITGNRNANPRKTENLVLLLMFRSPTREAEYAIKTMSSAMPIASTAAHLAKVDLDDAAVTIQGCEISWQSAIVRIPASPYSKIAQVIAVAARRGDSRLNRQATASLPKQSARTNRMLLVYMSWKGDQHTSQIIVGWVGIPFEPRQPFPRSSLISRRALP